MSKIFNRINTFFKYSSDYGLLIILVGLLCAVPLLVLPFYPEDAVYASAFLMPLAFSLVAGLVICFATYKVKETENSEWQASFQRGNLIVLFAWCYGFFLGAMPFYISGELDFVRALFESISGWTTTGLSVVDVTAMPKIFLFHRSFMQYSGGLGFILMMVLVVRGKLAMSLYSMEGHSDRLAPSLKKSSQLIFLIYNGFLLLGVVLYLIFGMELFDAICHTMSALSTAGFTTQAQSIGQYNSVPIELVTVILMLIGASNFAALFLLVKGKFGQVLKLTETRVMLGLCLLFVPLCAVSLMFGMEMDIFESLRQSLFGVVTVFSTTGYATTDYSLWPPFAVGLLVLLMIIGGSSGSTAGGIKHSRTYLLLRITRENLAKKMFPARKVVSPKYNMLRGKMPIDDALVFDTFGFIVCYMLVFIVGALLMTLTAGCSLEDAIFEFGSALGTVGISNGMTSAATNTPTLIIEMVAMALGRLEILAVFFGLASVVQLIKQKITTKREDNNEERHL